MSDPFQSETALVLFSGGQDSTTCLAWALQRFARVEMLGFSYGQRHAIELACRDQLLSGLITMQAERAGDEETAQACAEILEQERAMAQFIDDNWDRFAAFSLAEEGISTG